MKKTILMIMLALLGMSQLGAQEYEYVPFVREGVKWVYCYTNVGDDYRPADPNLAYGIVYLTLEIKGDTIINGESYKAMHKYYGDAINEENDTIPIYLREEGQIVYGIVPDGKTFPDCPIGNRFEGAYFFEKLYDGKEFILYDFNDPEAYWNAEANNEENMDYYEPLSIDIISIGSNLAKRHVGRMGSQDFYQIEGIGVDASGSGYTLFPFRPMATGVDTYFQLSHVIEDGEIIYKSVNYKAPDPDGYEYVPLVREGVKWVCFYDNPCFVDEGFIPFGEHYFVLEIKGDICIDGKWYKPVHYYSGYSINEENDTVPVYLREENKVVYGIIPDDRRYWECPVGIGTIVNGLELYSDVKTSMEFILYDFNDPVGFYENLCPEISPRLHYSHEEMVQIGNSLRKRLVFNRIGSPDVYLGHEYIIEGIGYVGESPGMPLNYFYDINTGNIQVIYKLSHVIDGPARGQGCTDGARHLHPPGQKDPCALTPG